jgi:hypothetical protein
MIVDAWDQLPEAIKAGIKALVRAAMKPLEANRAAMTPQEAPGSPLTGEPGTDCQVDKRKGYRSIR